MKKTKPKVVFEASGECLNGLGKTLKGGKPDHTLTRVSVPSPSDFGKASLGIKWETKSAGFGELSIWHTPDGELRIDTEMCSKQFVMAVFEKLVDDLMKKEKKRQASAIRRNKNSAKPRKNDTHPTAIHDFAHKVATHT